MATLNNTLQVSAERRLLRLHNTELTLVAQMACLYTCGEYSGTPRRIFLEPSRIAEKI